MDAASAGQPDVDARRNDLRRAVDQVQSGLDRLTAAVLAGGEAATLVQAMKDRERRRDALQRDLEILDRPRSGPGGREHDSRVAQGARYGIARPAAEARAHRAADASETDCEPDHLHAPARDPVLRVQHTRRLIELFQRVSLSTRCGVPSGIRQRLAARRQRVFGLKAA
jgi:hypothetical protein